MRLAGRWIEHAGFESGQRVRIAVEYGYLTITAEQPRAAQAALGSSQ
ncbi:SymE family type I addiction module toxin [Paraburkholderia xenovorans]